MKIVTVIAIAATISVAQALDCHAERDRGYTCEKAETIRFYYDTRIGVCQPLFYRGCGGNENNFNSSVECMDTCKPKKVISEAKAEIQSKRVVDVCGLSTDAKVDELAQKCDNGCPNGYACNEANKCCPMKGHICSLPVSSGSEAEAYKHYGRYAYQPGLKNCIRFSYFGKGGNYNNFLTYNDCKNYCVEKPKKKTSD